MTGSDPNCSPLVTYALRVDWNNDGDYADPNDAVIGDALRRAPIAFAYGRDQARALSPTGPGQLGFALCNADLTYSPGPTGATGSPISLDVLPGRKVQLLVTPTGSPTVTGFHGRVDDLTVHTERADRSVDFTVLDALQELSTTPTSTALFRGVRTGTAIGHVLDDVGWPAGQRDLDPGGTVIEWWASSGNALEAIQQLVQSEGPPAIFYIEGGVAVFKDRHHRILDTKSITSQATYCIAGTDKPGECVTASPCPTGSFKYTDPLGYDHGMKNIVNSARLTANFRRADPKLEYVYDPVSQFLRLTNGVIWESSESIVVPLGETYTITADLGDLAYDLAPPDYTIGDLVTDGNINGEVAVLNPSLSQTSGASVDVTFDNQGTAEQTITRIRLRGISVPVTSSITVSRRDEASIAAFGEQTYPDSAPWANRYDTEAIEEIVVGTRKERVPILSVRTVNGDQALQNQLTARRISDRVTVRSDRLGIDDDFYVERIDQAIRALGRVHESTLGCEQVVDVQPSTTAYAGPVFDASTAVTGLGGAITTHSGGAAPRAVLIWTLQSGSTTSFPMTATYGQVSIPLVETASTNSGGRWYRFFRGSGVPSGTRSVNVTDPDLVNTQPCWTVIVTFNADATVNVYAVTNASNTNANPTVNVTTSQQALLLGLLHSGQNDVTGVAPGAGYVDVGETDFGTDTGSVIRRTALLAAGTNAVNWTAGADNWTVSGIALTVSGAVFQFDGGVGHRFNEGVFAL